MNFCTATIPPRRGMGSGHSGVGKTGGCSLGALIVASKWNDQFVLVDGLNWVFNAQEEGNNHYKKL